jgi:hypothetical protein
VSGAHAVGSGANAHPELEAIARVYAELTPEALAAVLREAAPDSVAAVAAEAELRRRGWRRTSEAS